MRPPIDCDADTGRGLHFGLMSTFAGQSLPTRFIGALMSKPSLLVALFCPLFIGSASGCTNTFDADPETGLVAESAEQGSVIVGAVNWQDVGLLDDNSQERQNSRAVGYLSIPARGNRCTAFIVAPDLVMTNEHCIPQASSAQGARLSMRREAGVPQSQWASFDCSTFVGNSRALDYALLRCSGRPGDTFGVVDLEARQTRTQESLYVVHQNCDYYSQPGCNPTKKISRGVVVRVNSEIGHSADTLGGSSGAPVFTTDTHAVFALHHVGIGGNQNGRGSYNKAVPMRDILADVERRFPSVSFGSDGAGLDADPYEPNNSEADATGASAGANAEGLTITAGDRDVFRIDVPSATTLTVNVAFSHASGDLDVDLFAGSLSSTRIANGVSADDDERVQAEVGPGIHYLVVYGYAGATNTYAINFQLDGVSDDVQTPTDPAPAPSGAEPNDDFGSASSLAAPASLSGVAIDHAEDVDVYRVDHTGGPLRAQLDFVNANGDLDLFLLDLSGTERGRSNGVTDQEVIASTLAAGTYFLRVTGYRGATGAYTITLE